MASDPLVMLGGMALSHSGRQEFDRCKRMYFYSRVQKLELAEGPPKGRRMGRAFARALELGKPAAGRDLYPVELTDEDQLELAQIQTLAEAYLHRYGMSDLTEVEFNNPISGVGRLDGIITDENGVFLFGQEDKLLTKNFWRDADERRLDFDSQVSAYFYAMREAGSPLQRIEYRVTFKPTITWRRSRQPETLDEYVERLKQRIAAEPADFFRRFDLYRTDAQLQEFEDECKDLAADLASTKRRGVWRKNTGACTMYGECAFMSLCRNEPNAIMKYRRKPQRPKSKPQRAVLAALLSSFVPPTTKELSMQAGLDTRGASNAARALVRQGLVSKTEHHEHGVTTWQLTDAGTLTAESLIS